VLSVLGAITSCSDERRHRALTFFFDGVPEPGATPPPQGYAPLIDAQRRPFQVRDQQPAPVAMTYAHEPFRTNDCTGCHNRSSGELVRPANEGLCQSCHADVPGRLRYVHGPVAVGDCAYCHHPHGSAHAHVLVSEPTPLCLSCHARGDLSTGAHHAESETRACSDCHHGHGGQDPYYLKRLEP